MFNGGPIDMNIGWPVVGIMVIIVGLAMAEVCSSYPTAGGLYYWSAKLGGKNGAAWSWFTGWFNLVGQVAVTAGIDGGLALFASAFMNNWFGYPLDPPHILLVYAIALFLHGLLNTFGVRLVALLNDISVWWHITGVVVIVAVLLIAPCIISRSRSSSPASTTATGASFPGNVIYVFLIGLLLAQYTFTGYDASAHMTEETKNAATAGPRGIVLSIVVSLVAGWILLIGVTSAIQNYAAESTAVVPAAQIFIDAAGKGLGQFLLLIAIGAQFYCGMSSVTANSRMIYAFSRDGAVPGHQLWSKINKRTRTPTNSIWLAVVGAFILFLPYLFNAYAYAAVISIAVIGLYIAYGIPILLRLRVGIRLPTRPVEPGEVEPTHRHHRGHVDRDHQHPVHPADGIPDHRDQLQLHDRRVRGRPWRHHDLVVRVREELVQGSEGPGHCRRTGVDRGDVRRRGSTDARGFGGLIGSPIASSRVLAVIAPRAREGSSTCPSPGSV